MGDVWHGGGSGRRTKARVRRVIETVTPKFLTFAVYARSKMNADVVESIGRRLFQASLKDSQRCQVFRQSKRRSESPYLEIMRECQQDEEAFRLLRVDPETSRYVLPDAYETAIATLVGMGFDLKRCEAVMPDCNNSVETAISVLLGS